MTVLSVAGTWHLKSMHISLVLETFIFKRNSCTTLKNNRPQGHDLIHRSQRRLTMTVSSANLCLFENWLQLTPISKQNIKKCGEETPLRQASGWGHHPLRCAGGEIQHPANHISQHQSCCRAFPPAGGAGWCWMQMSSPVVSSWVDLNRLSRRNSWWICTTDSLNILHIFDI